MSFKVDAEGTVDEVLAATDKWRDEVLKVDESYGASVELKDAHERQIAAAISAVAEHAINAPRGRKLSVTLRGHANSDGTGDFTVSVQESHAPTPVVEESSAAGTQGDGAGAGDTNGGPTTGAGSEVGVDSAGGG